MPEWLIWTLFIGLLIAAGFGAKYRDEKIVSLIEERQALKNCISVIEAERKNG